MAITIALDIGYGFTKSTDGERAVIFPSVGGDAVVADFDNELVRASKGKVITVNGQNWHYGHTAQKHSRNQLALFARERTEQQDLMRVLFYAALAELGVGGICIAVRILADAGVLEGRNATIFQSETSCDVLKDAGATCTGNPVERDGNVITAQGPTTSSSFARMIVAALVETY